MNAQRILFVAGMVYVLSLGILLVTNSYNGYLMLAHLLYGAIFFPIYYRYVVRGPRARRRDN